MPPLQVLSQSQKRITRRAELLMEEARPPLLGPEEPLITTGIMVLLQLQYQALSVTPIILRMDPWLQYQGVLPKPSEDLPLEHTT